MSATRLRRLRDPAARTVDSPRNINLLSPGCQCPRPDSNGNLRIRRPMLYPLSYGGVRKRLTSLRHQHGGPGLDGRTAPALPSAPSDGRKEITPA